MTIIGSYICVNCKVGHQTSQIHDLEYRICSRCRKDLIKRKEPFVESEINDVLSNLESKINLVNERIRVIDSKMAENKVSLEQQMTSLKKVIAWFGFNVIPKKIEKSDFEYRKEKRETKWKLKELESEFNFNKAIIVRKIIPAQRRFQHKSNLKLRKKEALEKHRSNSFKQVSGSINYDRSDYLIRNIDYKRGNPLDNYFRNNLYTSIVSYYDSKCILCDSKNDLTLDHFWLPKNEGGNFAMLHIESKALVSNVIPLCRSCNSAKSDRPVQNYFTPEELRRINKTQQLISRELMNNPKLLEVASKWYKKKIEPLL